jgi:hypothetical protein
MVGIGGGVLDVVVSSPHKQHGGVVQYDLGKATLSGFEQKGFINSPPRIPTACVDCFGYVQLGRHFGRDFQTDVLALNCARLRLTRWGQAVNIYDDPKLGRQDATPAEIQTAKDTLHHILRLFADTGKISKKYSIS